MKLPGTAANEEVARIVNLCLPKRWRLPVLFHLNRILGRLEEEIALVPALTKSKGVAVDVGASSGYYSFVMASCCAQVEAFEPLAANTRNLTDYGSPKIRVHHVALSNASGAKSFYLPLIDGAGSYGRASLEVPPRGPYDVVEVELRRLDDFGLRDVSLIKIDVEGHELEVLEGARNTIADSRPVLIIEISNCNKDRVEAFFAGLGYRPSMLAAGRLEPLPGGLRDPKVNRVNFVYQPA